MFWHPLYLFAVGFFQSLLAALPPWSIVLGGGYATNAGADGHGNGIDGGALHDFCAAVAYFDRFMPISDGFGPVIGIIAVTIIGMNIIKLFKWVISLIPTISGAG